MLESDGKSRNLRALGVAQVDNALNWSWLVDLGQGNFSLAKTAAEVALLDRWDSSTLFARGVVHRLQGEFTLALSIFEEAFSCSESLEQQLIIATVAYLTELQVNNLFPDGCAVITQPQREESEWAARMNYLQEKVDDLLVQIENNFLDLIWVVLPNFRTLILNITQKDRQQEYLQDIQYQLTAQLELYQNLELFTISEILYSSLAELLALTGNLQPGWEIIAKLADAYKQADKYLETAWYRLCQGDLIAAVTPVGKPILFGYCLVSETNQHLIDRSLLDRATAQELYLKARQYFAAAGARRGEGIAIARLAYLNAISQQWHLATHGYQEAEEYFTATGDRLNAIAAQMGAWWTLLHYQELEPDGLIEIESTILSLKANGAIAWGLSWGLVFVHAATEAWHKEQDIEVALRLATVAETIVTIFAEEDLANSPSFQQLLTDFQALMASFYNQIAEFLAKGNKWEEAFPIAEMARFYALDQTISSPKQLSVPLLTIQDVVAKLPPDTLLITYLVTEKYLLAWAINSRGLVGQNLEFDPTAIIRTTKQWLEDLQTKQINLRHGDAIAINLLQSFAPEINTAQHLVIVPGADLELFPLETLPWEQEFLAQQKSLSYLLTVNQLATQKSQVSPGALIAIDLTALPTYKTQENQNPTIAAGTAQVIADLYDVQPYSGKQRTVQELNDLITSSQTIVHLFLDELTIPSGTWNTDVVMISLNNIKLTQPQIIRTLIRELNQSGVKTIIINRYLHNEMAMAMLLLFFHLNWRSGYSLAQCLWQAQHQLCQVTVQEALDFGQMVQNQLPWQQETELASVKLTAFNRANRAMILKYLGDILVVGGDYERAVEAYGVAIKMLNANGYTQSAQILQNQYVLMKSLAKNPVSFQPDRLIFNSPEYWSSFMIFGNWQASINS